MKYSYEYKKKCVELYKLPVNIVDIIAGDSSGFGASSVASSGVSVADGSNILTVEIGVESSAGTTLYARRHARYIGNILSKEMGKWKKNTKIIITILFMIFAFNPFELYYNARTPSIYQQRIYFDKEFSLLNLNEFREREKEIFKNKTYIIVLENDTRMDYQNTINIIRNRFSENDWLFLNENKNTRGEKTKNVIMLFEKKEYRSEVEVFSSEIVLRFWHKNYYGK